MKKSIMLLFVFGLLLSSCDASLDNTSLLGDKLISATEEDKGAPALNQNKMNSPSQNDTFVEEPTEQLQQALGSSEDASVEVLIKIGKDFIKAAYNNDVEEMADYCDDFLGEKIQENPKTYVGTKPNYNIDKIDMSITPLEGKGTYLLMSTVYTTKKGDNKKYNYKYSIIVEKVTNDYFITEFRRES